MDFLPTGKEAKLRLKKLNALFEAVDANFLRKHAIHTSQFPTNLGQFEDMNLLIAACSDQPLQVHKCQKFHDLMGQSGGEFLKSMERDQNQAAEKAREQAQRHPMSMLPDVNLEQVCCMLGVAFISFEAIIVHLKKLS